MASVPAIPGVTPTAVAIPAAEHGNVTADAATGRSSSEHCSDAMHDMMAERMQGCQGSGPRPEQATIPFAATIKIRSDLEGQLATSIESEEGADSASLGRLCSQSAV